MCAADPPFIFMRMPRYQSFSEKERAVREQQGIICGCVMIRLYELGEGEGKKRKLTEFHSNHKSFWVCYICGGRKGDEVAQILF